MLFKRMLFKHYPFTLLFVLSLIAASYGGDTLRIASWNWRDASFQLKDKDGVPVRGSRDWGEINLAAHVIETADFPDIIVFQEINDELILKALELELCKIRPHYESYTTIPTGDGSKEERYGFLWNTDTVLRSDQRYYPLILDMNRLDLRQPVGLKFDWNGLEFKIFSYHAPWKKEDRHFNNKALSGRLWDYAFNETNLLSESSMRLIVCGDFNEGDNHEDFNRMATFYTAAIPYMDTTVGKTQSPYDEIWIKKFTFRTVKTGLVKFDSWVNNPKEAISDHYMVYVDLQPK